MRKTLYTLFFVLGLILLLVSNADKALWMNSLAPWFIPAISLYALPILIFETLFLIIFIFKNHWGMFFMGLIIISVSWVNITGYTKADISQDYDISVASVNLLWNNENHYDEAKSILNKKNPDVVFIQEYNRDTDLVGLYDMYPYKAEGTPSSLEISNVMILSKIPFADSGTVKIESKYIPWARIYIEGNPVALLGIHTMSPTNSERTQFWFKDLEDIKKWSIKNNSRLISAGDYNANVSMLPFRELLKESNLRVTNHYIPTWGFESFKTTVIDHVLLSKELDLKTLEVYNVLGSDHSLTYAEINVN